MRRREGRFLPVMCFSQTDQRRQRRMTLRSLPMGEGLPKRRGPSKSPGRANWRPCWQSRTALAPAAQQVGGELLQTVQFLRRPLGGERAHGFVREVAGDGPRFVQCAA